ncbi:MAG TPA: Nramp family divalent metal transporter [Nocardioidaceae bacterium]|nr:Nramp family divalent metal transporter [Nocardioidaceae bacterium]
MTAPDIKRRTTTAPETRDLPEVPALRKMVGPGVIAVGIGMAAGEIIIWPYITSIAGFGLLWLAIVTLIMQVVINMEIERYTLATGQTVVAGFSRWWKGWGALIILGGVFQYAWPGWATSAATVFSFTVGGDATWVAVISLWVIGLLLSASPVVYKTVEKVEVVKVAATIFFLAVITVAVLTWRTMGSGAASLATSFGQIPKEVPFVLMLSAIGAAGAGGVHNLVISNWIRDKGYGMGAHVPRLVSPLTGHEEAAGTDRYAFPETPENMTRWALWWKRANIEHFVSFFVICFITISLMSFLAYQTLYGRDDVTTDNFLQIQGEILGSTVGAWLKVLFFSVAVVSLWAAALGLLDVIGRVSADFVKRNYLADSTISESKLYFAFVWAEILFGSAILLLGIDQPLALLLISTCAASVVTLIYSVLLIRLNSKDLPKAIGIRGWRLVMMCLAVGFYAFFAIGTLVTQVQDKLL